MSERIVVIGAGYTGLRLAARAIEAGIDVVGTTRSAEHATELTELGAIPVEFDVLDDDPATLAEYFGPTTSVVYSVPTLFDEPEDARHTAPVERLLDTAAAAGCARFVYLSSTSVYGDYSGERVDESSPRRPTSPVGVMRRDIEDVVLERADIATNVVRIVGIYGPGRTLDRYIERGRYKLVGGGEKKTNRIHVDDLAAVVLAVVERGASGAYIASDGHPVRVVDLVDWMVEHLGIERPEEVSLEAYRAERGENAAARWENTYIADNRRIVEELGVELRYPTVIEGYEAIAPQRDSAPA